MKYSLKGSFYQADFDVSEHSACLSGGHFGEIELVNSPLFTATVRRLPSGEDFVVSSASHWARLRTQRYSNTLKFYFSDPKCEERLMFVLEGVQDEDGISWRVEVLNSNPALSVMHVSYPAPTVTGARYDCFYPTGGGRVMSDAGNRPFSEKRHYPTQQASMQFFAAYGKKDGIYIGLEDERAAGKCFTVYSEQKKTFFELDFYGIGGGLGANSFRLYGISRWGYLKGDWYDAAMLYRDFVLKKATWLPDLGKDGREDTEKRFRDIPFWVCDYIPNSTYQGENRPMMISAGSDRYDKGYWIDAVIRLQKELDVPIAYHVYNWHEIPFNVEYPHFLPAKQVFLDGLKELKKHPIYVFPYINAVSWDTADADCHHEINFENTGRNGAVLDENGNLVTVPYPQTTVRGTGVELAPICPSFEPWHELIASLSIQMEQELPIDGIYFDQVSAARARPCYNPEHAHAPGGGSFWAEGYTRMMEKINASKPEGHFYFSEGNGEPYMKSFDGFLTWTWVYGGDVPAFPAIYSGYVVMLGCSTLGKKKEDTPFFKYTLAKSLLYGLQLGWCKADVIDSPERLLFLKKMVKLRVEYTNIFSGIMLRPPKVVSNLAPVVSSPTLWYREEIIMRPISAGAWKSRDGNRLVIFVINTANKPGTYSLSFDGEEYAIGEYVLPEDFVQAEGTVKHEGTLAPNGYSVFEFRRKKSSV